MNVEKISHQNTSQDLLHSDIACSDKIVPKVVNVSRCDKFMIHDMTCDPITHELCNNSNDNVLTSNIESRISSDNIEILTSSVDDFIPHFNMSHINMSHKHSTLSTKPRCPVPEAPLASSFVTRPQPSAEFLETEPELVRIYEAVRKGGYPIIGERG